jgi:hypothetical protein
VRNTYRSGQAPLDFFKGVPWLANVGHVLAGYAVVLTAALWSTSFAPILWTTAVLVTYGLVKEYYLDLHFESDETVASSTVDFLGYMAGALAAWVEVLARAGVL